MNSINFRFGNIPYKADPLQRKLKVTNSSAAPVSIVWHVFLQSKDMQQPFNLIFDVHVSGDSDEDEHKSLFISDEFYGKEIGNDIFQVLYFLDNCHVQLIKSCAVFRLNLFNWKSMPCQQPQCP